MSQVQYEIPYVASRNRLTVLFRLILVIPHVILMAVWQYAVQLSAIIHWFICVITGRRNAGLWGFANSYLGYATRVVSYEGIMYDEYPAFGTDATGSPVRYELAYDEPASRLTVGLRLFWAIPALVIAWATTLAGIFVTIVAWFAILFTGSMPEGMFEFMLTAHRYAIQTQAYVFLLTDEYPAWG